MTSADYRVVVVQSTGKKEAILDIARLEYGDIINQIRTFSLTIGKSNEDDYSKFNAYEVVSGTETGIIYIYRQGTLDFAGIIENPTYDKFGRLVLTGIGMEVKIGWKGTGTDKTYSNSALSTIVTNMIGDISGIDVSEANNEDSADGNLTKVNISGMSYLDGLKHAIVDLGDNEWYMTYSDSGNSDFNNVQYRGSNTSIGKLVEGIDISRVQRTKNTQRIFNKVVAIGKAQGEPQVEITRDATDIIGDYDMAKYGTREPSHPLSLGRIQNTSDLTKYADNFLTQHMYPVEIITFDVDDIDFSHNVGDLVTIRAKARLKDTGDVNTADMRIISQKRIITPESERLILGVTKEGLNILPTDFSTMLSRVRDQIDAHQLVDQGNLETLTYTHAGKANSTNKAEMEFTLPDWITNSAQIKEAKLTVKRLPLYYDIGTATGDGTANVTDSGHSNHGVTGTVTPGNANVSDSGHSNHGVNGTTASREPPLSVGDMSDQADENVSANTWKIIYDWSVPNEKKIIFIFFGVKNDLSAQGWFTAKAEYYDYNGNSQSMPDSTGQKIWIEQYGWGYWFFVVPSSSSDILIRLKCQYGGTIRTSISESSLLKHTHTDGSLTDGTGNASVSDSGHQHTDGTLTDGTGTANVSDSGHTNTITQGINTVSESSLTFTYDTNGNTGNVGSLAVGGLSSELDVKSKINNPSSSRNNYIKLYPTSGNAITVYTLTIKAYRET